MFAAQAMTRVSSHPLDQRMAKKEIRPFRKLSWKTPRIAP